MGQGAYCTDRLREGYIDFTSRVRGAWPYLTEQDRSAVCGVTINGLNGGHGCMGNESRDSVHLNIQTLRAFVGRIAGSGFKLHPKAFGTLQLERLFGLMHRMNKASTSSVVGLEPYRSPRESTTCDILVY